MVIFENERFEVNTNPNSSYSSYHIKKNSFDDRINFYTSYNEFNKLDSNSISIHTLSSNEK